MADPLLFIACYKVGFWRVFAADLIKNHLRTQDNHYTEMQKLYDHIQQGCFYSRASWNVDTYSYQLLLLLCGSNSIIYAMYCLFAAWLLGWEDGILNICHCKNVQQIMSSVCHYRVQQHHQPHNTQQHNNTTHSEWRVLELPTGLRENSHCPEKVY